MPSEKKSSFFNNFFNSSSSKNHRTMEEQEADLQRLNSGSTYNSSRSQSSSSSAVGEINYNRYWSASSSSDRNSSGSWTCTLIFCNLIVVMGTSFMAGYNFRVTASHKILGALIFPPEDADPDLENDVVLKDQEGFTNFCNFTLFVARLLGMAYFSSAFGDKFGRRKTLFICSILGFVASLINLVTHLTDNFCPVGDRTKVQCVIPTFFGQATFGFQSGIAIIVAPTLLIELAPKRLRGSCGAFHELFFILGSTASLLAGVYLTGKKPDPFKFHLVFQFFIYIFQCVLLLFVRESPRWLFSQGRHDEALETLQKLRCVGETEAQLEVDEFRNREKPMSRRRFVLLVLVGAALSLAYLMTGRDVIDHFSTLGLIPLPEIETSAKILAITYLIVSVGTVLISIFCSINLINRRRLVLTSLTLIFVCIILLTLSFSFVNGGKCFEINDSNNGNFTTVSSISCDRPIWVTKLPILVAIFYIAAFSMASPIFSFMGAEMFGQWSRLSALGYSQSIGFAIYLGWRAWAEFGNLNFLSLHYFGVLTVYGAVCLVVLVFLYIYLPETSSNNGMSLESIAARIALRKQVVVPEKLALITAAACTKPGSDELNSIITQQDSPNSSTSSSSSSGSRYNKNNHSSNSNKNSPVDTFDLPPTFSNNFRRRSSAPSLSGLRFPVVNNNSNNLYVNSSSHPTAGDDGDNIEVVYDSTPNLEIVYDSNSNLRL